ncbi:MAG: T9SS type A sorting domain-containing protein [Flavobacteriales bacterium]|nr:T9SS type A sorting domain-containing protein [Flavobacteriales bacterium]
MGPDADTTNNETQKIINVRAQIPNIMASYTSSTNTFTINAIATSVDQLVSPTDLDFHPNGDLWVVNREVVATGGSTVKFTNPGLTNQTRLRQIDGNAWHFMSLPTGIAFSDNGNFGTSTGVFDANHNGGTPFTGPALWSSDPAIYALPSGGNGSHLDMLHGSPYCMGIASETANIFYVFDANSNDIVRYDFADDHGPGNADHSDGGIRRFAAPTVNWVNANVPSHLVLDKSSNWLYIADGGNGRVLRLDVSSGTVGGVPNFPQYEALAEYANVTGATWQVVADTGLIQPSGIDVIGNNMIVSDFSTGDIFIYDISVVPAVRIGRVQTSTSGVSGVVIGPGGKIWYTNTTLNTVVRIDPSQIITSITDNEVSNELIIYPNPSNGLLKVETSNELSSDASILIFDISGKEVYRNTKLSAFENTFDLSELSNGIYFLNLRSSSTTIVKKIMINH